MPLVLHSYRRCPFAIRVRVVLEEKCIAYETVEENLRAPSAVLLRLHPEGKVPLIIHDGEAIYESSVITEYLDEAFPGPVLTPASPRARAQMRLWTYWSHSAFKADLDSFKYRRPTDPEGLEKLRTDLALHLRKLEQGLANAFLLGEALTLADVHVFPFVRQLAKTPGADFIPARVDEWLAAIVGRPSFTRAMNGKSQAGSLA